MKRLFCLILIITIVSSLCLLPAQAEGVTFNFKTESMVTVFLSQCMKSYTEVNKFGFEWNSFANKAESLVIVPFQSLNGENYWTLKNYGLSKIDTLSTCVSEIVRQFVSYNKNVKLFVGTPEIDSSCMPYIKSSYPEYESYLQSIKTNVGEEIWNNNIVGVYYNQECLYNGKINPDNPLSNMQIAAMNTCAQYVHNTLKKLIISMPYYGTGVYADQINYNLAVLVNRTDIFDALTLQSTWISASGNEDVYKNFASIKRCIQQQKMLDADGNEEITRTSTLTKIGMKYEYNTASYKTFKSYIDEYATLLGTCPVSMYWQGDAATAINIAEELFSNDVLLGDLNYDNDVTALDYMMLKRMVLGTYQYDKKKMTAGDLNNNDKLDSADYLMLKRIVLGTYSLT